MTWNGPDSRRVTWRDKTVRLVPFLILSLLTVVGVTTVVALGAVKVGHENCTRIHRIVVVGSQLIKEQQILDDFLKAGTITPDEYERAVKDNERKQKIWLSADCLNVKDTP